MERGGGVAAETGSWNSCHQSQKLQQAEWGFSQTKMEEELKTEGQNCRRLVGDAAARGRFSVGGRRNAKRYFPPRV